MNPANTHPTPSTSRRAGRPQGRRRKAAPAKLLADHIPEEDAANEVGCHIRTLRKTDAPFVEVCGKRFYPIGRFQRWMAGRVRGTR
jgi:hypothetical protein